MKKLIGILRNLFAAGITVALFAGALSAALFVVAFVVGPPVAPLLCTAGLELMKAMIPIVSLVVLSGLLVIYLDPKEGHAFRLGQSRGASHEEEA